MLAYEATKLCHGETAAAEAGETAKATFEEGTQGAALPTVEIAETDLAEGMPAFEAFVRAGLANSNGEARRLIRGGGGRVNDTVIGDESQTISTSDLNEDGAIKFSAGKKRHALVKPF